MTRTGMLLRGGALAGALLGAPATARAASSPADAAAAAHEVIPAEGDEAHAKGDVAVAEGDAGPIDDALAELLDEPIVSTASKREERVSSAPATVFTITAEELRLHGLRTVEEAINYLGNSMTVQAPYGETGARGLLLSGDGGGHLLVLLDGHALNSEWGGWQRLDRALGVPIELIERIEISLGPGSVLYGTSAMFGVINIITKQPDRHEGFHAGVRGAIAPPVGADGHMRSATEGYRVGHEGRISFGWGRAFERMRRGGGLKFHLEAWDEAAPSTFFGPQNATYAPGPHVATPGVWGGIARRRSRGASGMLSLSLGRWQIDLASTGAVQRDPFEYDADFADPRTGAVSSEHRLDVRHTVDLGTRLRLASRIYGDGGTWVGTWIYSDAEYFCPGLSAQCSWSETTSWARAGIEERLTIDWLHDGRFVTLVGAEGRVRWVADLVTVTETASGRAIPSDLLDSSRVTGMGALYVEQSAWPLKRLALNAGLRLDLDQNFGWNVSPRAAVTVLPWKRATLKLLYAQAFRAPSVGEMLYEDPYYLRAEALDAERVRSLELTAEQRFAGGHGSFKLGGFYSWWRDLIAEGPITQAQFDAGVASGKLSPDSELEYIVQYQNHGRIQAFGGFAALSAHALDRRVQFGSNLGVAQAGEVEDGTLHRPLAVYPTVLGNARVAWVPGAPWPSLALAAFYNSPRRTTEEIEGAFVRPHRAGHHGQLRATVTGAIPKTQGLRYSISVDHNFAPFGAYMVGPRRSADDARWRGELYPLPRTTVMFGLSFDHDPRATRTRDPAAQRTTPVRRAGGTL